MLCHLVLPYEWVECFDDECIKIVHYPGDAETLNNCPKEWMKNLCGFSIEHKVGSLEVIYFTNDEGAFHRDNGLPAMENSEGTVYWYVNGECHRVDGPAIIWADGTAEWLQHSKLHRDDGPALIETDGTKTWYWNDVIHRDDGPAIEYFNGDKEWFINGKEVRVDGTELTYHDYEEKWKAEDRRRKLK